MPQAFKLLYESAAKFFPTSWEPQWKHSRKHRRAHSAADGSTRSERGLVNAHFNLNEPRTALRKHKMGEEDRARSSELWPGDGDTCLRTSCCSGQQLKNRFQQKTKKLSERMAIRADKRPWDQPTGIAEAGSKRPKTTRPMQP